MKKETGYYEGFIFNCVIYLIAMVVASFFPIVARTVLSFVIRTPDPYELRADFTYMFDVVYPIVGIVTGAAFIFGGWFCCRFAAMKVADKTGSGVSTFKMKMQLIVPSAIAYAMNLYLGFIDGFSGALGIFYWYPAAVLSSLFGWFDKTDVLDKLADIDFEVNGFVMKGLAYEFNAMTLVISVLYTAGFAFACYYGRKSGMNAGISKHNKRISDIRGTV